MKNNWLAEIKLNGYRPISFTISNRYIAQLTVIAAIYNSDGITRGEVWRKIGKGSVREYSADADLYKLLFRDLSTGSIIRQSRQVDAWGNFVAKAPQRRPKGSGPKPSVSAFDENEGYELTGLGKQFVHYTMSELSIKIEFKSEKL